MSKIDKSSRLLTQNKLLNANSKNSVSTDIYNKICLKKKIAVINILKTSHKNNENLSTFYTVKLLKQKTKNVYNSNKL